ncbi:hypothetical protein niasHT_021161 [Heterodera trifolii]|uniref:Sigma non-opioid intracellular receptor 1 n=1 Tax=Heterodera trifolii TaxID=157864 RepID=A0ABD2JF66_9BILA
MALLFTRLIRNVILVIVFFNVVSYYLRWKSYNIAARDFKTASVNSASNNALTAVSKFQSELKRITKGQSISSDSTWVPLSVGGLHLRLQIAYATLFEAVTLLAAPSPTVGRSGLHWANSTCTVLVGEVVRHSDAYSGLVKETFTSAQNFRHGQFESYVYEFKEGTHVVCYWRGFIPTSGLSALVGAVASGDLLGAARLVFSYSKVTFENTAVFFVDTFNHLKNKAMKMEL